MGGPLSKRVVLYTMMAVGVVLLTLPTVVIVGASFSAGEIMRFPPDGLSLRWYGVLLESTAFQQALLRSLYVGLICIVISVPTGTLCGIALVRYRIRMLASLRMYLMLPFTIPIVVSGFGMLLVFGQIGILGQLWPVGFATCAINIPFMIWSVSATANRIDPDLENAAANCGATPLQVFFTVTLPAVMPGVITGSLLMFVLAINEFLVSLLLVNARIVTLPVMLYSAVRGAITPDLAAVSVVYIVIAAVAIWLLDRLVGLEVFLKSD